MKKRIDIYQTVTDKILEVMESGELPWMKPWKDGKNADGTLPYNASTGRQYNGMNILLLWASPYSSNGWITYNQAGQLGGNVMKGEKSTLITYYQMIKKGDNGEDSFPLLKGYKVFNVEQCENLNLKGVEPIIVNPMKALALAEDNLAKVVHGGNQAFFRSSGDYIQMPPQKNFESEDAYQAVLLHELTHWAGSKKRLNREFGKRFGDDAYAFEELIAELGSAFLCAQMGIELNVARHSSYLQSWIKTLKQDKKAIFTASSQSKKSTEALMGYQFNSELAIDTEAA